MRMLRPTGVLYCRAALSAPWGIDLPALEGVMMLEVVTSGRCWVRLGDRPPQSLTAGSLVLLPRGSAHRLVSTPDAQATALADIPVQMAGPRFEIMQYGGHGDETGISYCGVRFDTVAGRRLINQLPDFLHLKGHEQQDPWLRNTVEFMACEAEKKLPGSETVMTRLADILVIQALRTWIEDRSNEKHGWLAALRDPGIGKALLLMHRHPEHNWNVAGLAREAGLSRSGFAARFSDYTGEAVLQYLTQIRMELAHRMLLETTESLVRIAERVGYQSEQAFNRAYRRVMGLTPGSVRRNSRAD